MQWIKTIAAELFGLFVDDGSFAIAIIVWLGTIWLLSRHLSRGTGWSGVALFAGLGVILFWSMTRRARQFEGLRASPGFLGETGSATRSPDRSPVLPVDRDSKFLRGFHLRRLAQHSWTVS
jgi:hypothetical protein